MKFFLHPHRSSYFVFLKPARAVFLDAGKNPEAISAQPEKPSETISAKKYAERYKLTMDLIDKIIDGSIFTSKEFAATLKGIEPDQRTKLGLKAMEAKDAIKKSGIEDPTFFEAMQGGSDKFMQENLKKMEDIFQKYVQNTFDTMMKNDSDQKGATATETSFNEILAADIQKDDPKNDRADAQKNGGNAAPRDGKSTAAETAEPATELDELGTARKNFDTAFQNLKNSIAAQMTAQDLGPDVFKSLTDALRREAQKVGASNDPQEIDDATAYLDGIAKNSLPSLVKEGKVNRALLVILEDVVDQGGPTEVSKKLIEQAQKALNQSPSLILQRIPGNRVFTLSYDGIQWELKKDPDGLSWRVNIPNQAAVDARAQRNSAQYASFPEVTANAPASPKSAPSAPTARVEGTSNAPAPHVEAPSEGSSADALQSYNEAQKDALDIAQNTPGFSQSPDAATLRGRLNTLNKKLTRNLNVLSNTSLSEADKEPQRIRAIESARNELKGIIREYDQKVQPYRQAEKFVTATVQNILKSQSGILSNPTKLRETVETELLGTSQLSQIPAGVSWEITAGRVKIRVKKGQFSQYEVTVS